MFCPLKLNQTGCAVSKAKNDIVLFAASDKCEINTRLQPGEEKWREPSAVSTVFCFATVHTRLKPGANEKRRPFFRHCVGESNIPKLFSNYGRRNF
jgi:hypothetical protein